MRIFPFGKIRLAITIGDAAGIGPEVIVRSLSRLKLPKRSYVVIADPALLNSVAKKAGLKLRFGASQCFFDAIFPAAFKRGASRKDLTRLAVTSIDVATELALRGEVDGIVTAPINKAALQAAGFNIPGHTEYLAKLSGAKRFEMMLVGGKLRVVLVTRHTALRDVPAQITAKRVEETILLADEELRRSFGIARPRIVVCGLNPHAGEKGTLGYEEIDRILPAVEAARKKTDAALFGPLSADALFADAYAGKYDAEICMYHDQGLVPLKMISRGRGVNVTLGLPFVRTSPDHGTAYDIAPSFQADAGSMIQAIQTAFKICRARRKHDTLR